jgi:excisionase family DNA binding protein
MPTIFYGDHPPTVTYAQAATALNVDVNTIARWVRSETCPVIVDGRRKRIPAAWVTEQIALSVPADRQQR